MPAHIVINAINYSDPNALPPPQQGYPPERWNQPNAPTPPQVGPVALSAVVTGYVASDGPASVTFNFNIGATGVDDAHAAALQALASLRTFAEELQSAVDAEVGRYEGGPSPVHPQ